MALKYTIRAPPLPSYVFVHMHGSGLLFRFLIIIS